MRIKQINNFVKFKIKMKLIIKLAFVFIIFSCGNEKHTREVNTEKPQEETFYTYKVVSENLLKNYKLNNWDTNAKPSNWDINEDFEMPEDYVIDRDTLDLLLRGDKSKKVFLKQVVNIEPNSFYVLSCNVGSSLKSSSYAGISVSREGSIIGKRIFNNQEKQNYNVVFNSLEGENIECYFGFIEAGEGDLKIKEMSLKK